MLVDLTTVAVVVAAATMALTPPPIFVFLLLRMVRKALGRSGRWWKMWRRLRVGFENSFVAVSTRGFMYRVRYSAGRHL